MEQTTNRLRPVKPTNDRYKANINKENSHNYKWVKYCVGTIVILCLTACIAIWGVNKVDEINTTQAIIQNNFSKAGFRIFENSAERDMALTASLFFKESTGNDSCQYISNNTLFSAKYLVNKQNKTISLYGANGTAGKTAAICTISYENKI